MARLDRPDNWTMTWRRWRARWRPVTFVIEEPTDLRIQHQPTVRFRGWSFARDGSNVHVVLRLHGLHDRCLPPGTPRPDVADYFGLNFAPLAFDATIDLRGMRLAGPLTARVEFRSTGRSVRSADYTIEPCAAAPLQRGHYKAAWNADASSGSRARFAVAGYDDEANWLRSGAETARMIRDRLAIGPADVVLEIGAGAGRVGRHLAPLCRQWIGADVSENMLHHLRQDLHGTPNIQTVALSGYDLTPIADAAIDAVYATTVFMHLDEWERWSYVKDSHRVLRPGGRLLVDNFNLLSDAGWAIFQQQITAYAPQDRPAHISKSSTPQELEAYFNRAGFEHIQIEEHDHGMVTITGRKPMV